MAERAPHASRCRHGIPEKSDILARIPLIDMYTEALDDVEQKIDAELAHAASREGHVMRYAIEKDVVKLNLWSQPSAKQYVDEKMVRLLLAIAADMSLTDDIVLARTYYMLAFELRMAIDNSQGDVMKLRDLLSETPELLQTFQKKEYKTSTERGIKIALDRELPCNCLAGSKETPKTSRC